MTLKRKLDSDFDDDLPVVFVTPSHRRRSFSHPLAAVNQTVETRPLPKY